MKYLVLLFALFCFGCAMPNYAFHQGQKQDVYLDYTNSWITHPAKQNTNQMVGITIRAINKKYKNVVIDVSCRTEYGTIFGKKTVVVHKRNDKVFVIRGFMNGVGTDITCKIDYVR